MTNLTNLRQFCLYTLLPCAGDSMTNVVSVEWTSDEDMVVLEVFEDGGKQGRDSEPTTWKEVMEEFEENGLEYTINNHECIRQEGQASEDGHGEQADGDHGVGGYSISPKKTKVYFQYGWQQGNYKYSNVASAFSVDLSQPKAILTHRLGLKSWRCFCFFACV